MRSRATAAVLVCLALCVATDQRYDGSPQPTSAPTPERVAVPEVGHCSLIGAQRHACIGHIVLAVQDAQAVLALAAGLPSTASVNNSSDVCSWQAL